MNGEFGNYYQVWFHQHSISRGDILQICLKVSILLNREGVNIQVADEQVRVAPLVSCTCQGQD